jgi:transglutaminase-like putative cysteine protease
MGTTDRTSGEVQTQVECHLTLDVVDDATIVLQIAPASTAGAVSSQTLEVVLDGRPLEVEELDGERGGLIHVVRCPPGALTIDLQSTLSRVPTAEPSPTTGMDRDQITYLRQSRYCPSDELSGFAAYELGHLKPSQELLIAVGDWVGSRLTYEIGSSGPLDSAVDSLFHGRGVCRDFANLAITMLRALDVPARLAAVYAPGLSPMDFHAVVEAHVEGRWWVIDPTHLAPRQSLLRVSTGRDAADTAFLASVGGEVRLNTMEVAAFTEGDLPFDDHTALVALP